jgi:hypothetical protein
MGSRVDHPAARLAGFGSLTVRRKLSMISVYQVGADDRSRYEQPRSSGQGGKVYPSSGLATHYDGCEDAGKNEPRKAFPTSC